MEDKIIAYIEGYLTEAEKEVIEQQLQHSERWQKSF